MILSSYSHNHAQCYSFYLTYYDHFFWVICMAGIPSCAMLCPPWDHPKSDREKFNAPLLKSVIDCVVFGHDLDFSNDKSCNDPFKATAGIRSGWELQIA